MTTCRHCGIPIELTVGPRGRTWVHLTDRAAACHTTEAQPLHAVPSPNELDELLAHRWSAYAIADLYGTTRQRIETVLRHHRKARTS